MWIFKVVAGDPCIKGGGPLSSGGARLVVLFFRSLQLQLLQLSPVMWFPRFLVLPSSTMVRNICCFFSSRSLKTREKSISFAQLVLLSFYIFLVFTCQFLNDKIHNYVKKIHLILSSFKSWKVNTLPSKNIQTETK